MFILTFSSYPYRNSKDWCSHSKLVTFCYFNFWPHFNRISMRIKNCETFICVDGFLLANCTQRWRPIAFFYASLISFRRLVGCNEFGFNLMDTSMKKNMDKFPSTSPKSIQLSVIISVVYCITLCRFYYSWFCLENYRNIWCSQLRIFKIVLVVYVSSQLREIFKVP